jgi:transposase
VAQNAFVRRQLKARLSQIEKQIREIEEAMTAIVGGRRKRSHDVARSSPAFPASELSPPWSSWSRCRNSASLEGKQAASLAGLAPMTRESGSWKGRSHIQGGRASLRCGLYMPALVALRINPDLRRKYEALKAGKPSKVAIAAVMRKLIVLANRAVRSAGRPG